MAAMQNALEHVQEAETRVPDSTNTGRPTLERLQQDTSELPGRPSFEPKDASQIQLQIALPDELWLAILECPCTFPPHDFDAVMLNLLKNPNLTSSHLFRADILYDSDDGDHFFDPESPMDPQHCIAQRLKPEHRPRLTSWPDFQLQRTVVRQLIPRNPRLDAPLAQTCLFFRQQALDGDEERALVLYLPHVDTPAEMPFYHPAVAQLAFLHSWRPPPPSPTGGEPSHPDPSNTTDTSPGTLTLLYRPFPSHPLTTRLHRTGLHLLRTTHKHGQGNLAGYAKRVRHDQILPQKRYQDTYARLKARYGRQISEQWVEVTDPGKHVFEDIGIAAFLVELWGTMFRAPPAAVAAAAADNDDDDDRASVDPTESFEQQSDATAKAEQQDKPPFPGFVDIGCGNGVLVHILLSEGYPGSGFDARARKTWTIFPPAVQQRLQQQILVPEILQDHAETGSAPTETWHDGTFAPGTFIVSNHADELTAWTPLLASLNQSAFIAIPCCSHDLAGARFRAPATTRAGGEAVHRLPQQDCSVAESKSTSTTLQSKQAAETGSLRRSEAQKAMPSAYATLCSYVAALARDVGFEPETEVLRIPSTRNSCIVGRRRRETAQQVRADGSRDVVVEIVERELRKSIEAVAAEWIGRAENLMKKPGSGH